MRAAEVTDLLAIIVVARMRGIEEDSAFFRALRAVVRAWREDEFRRRSACRTAGRVNAAGAARAVSRGLRSPVPDAPPPLRPAQARLAARAQSAGGRSVPGYGIQHAGVRYGRGRDARANGRPGARACASGALLPAGRPHPSTRARARRSPDTDTPEERRDKIDLLRH